MIQIMPIIILLINHKNHHQADNGSVMPQCIETTGAGSGALLKRCNDDDEHGDDFDDDHDDHGHDHHEHHDVGLRGSP